MRLVVCQSWQIVQAVFVAVKLLRVEKRFAHARCDEQEAKSDKWGCIAYGSGVV